MKYQFSIFLFALLFHTSGLFSDDCSRLREASQLMQGQPMRDFQSCKKFCDAKLNLSGGTDCNLICSLCYVRDPSSTKPHGKVKTYEEPDIYMHRKGLENLFCETESFCYKEAMKQEPKAAKGACQISTFKLLEQQNEYFKYSTDLSIINYSKEGKAIIFPCEFYFNAITKDVSYQAKIPKPAKEETTSDNSTSKESEKTSRKDDLIEKQLSIAREKLEAGRSAKGSKGGELIQAAIRDYHKAISIDPNVISSYMELIQAHAELKQYEDAINIVEKAIEVSKKKKSSEKPKDELANLYHQKSLILAMSGEIESAAKLLRLADKNGYQEGNREEYLLIECRDYFTKNSLKKIASKELQKWLSSTCELWWH